MCFLRKHDAGDQPAIGRTVRSLLVALLATVVASCVDHPQTVLERLLESRRLSAEMLVQFEKSLEAGNRAVMADTDAESATAVRDAGQATESLRSDAKNLAGLLAKLGYDPEQAELREFTTRFDGLAVLDREILGLAALDTNIKAQKLSFGQAQDAATEFAAALEPLRIGSNSQTHAMASDAVAALREIQILEAPHIAEPEESAMDRIEVRMRSEEAIARKNVSSLLSVASAQPAARAASQAFDKFMKHHVEILQLSRRNSNVKSLALSLGKKRTLAAQCEDSLRSLQMALEKREIASGVR